MSQSSSSLFLNELLQGSGSRALAWVNDVLVGKQAAPEDFNWLGLAEVAGFRATSGLDRTWAQVAISADDRLARTKTGNSFGYQQSAMQLRAYLIGKLGPTPDDPVLDMGSIIRWFYNDLPFCGNREEIVKVANSLREMSHEEWRQHLDELRQLRQLKNRISVLKTIASMEGGGDLDEQLQSWIALWDDLP